MHYELDIEILLGNVTAYLTRNSDQKVLIEYPCPMNSSHHIKDNIIQFRSISAHAELINQGPIDLTREQLTLKLVA